MAVFGFCFALSARCKSFLFFFWMSRRIERGLYVAFRAVFFFEMFIFVRAFFLAAYPCFFSVCSACFASVLTVVIFCDIGHAVLAKMYYHKFITISKYFQINVCTMQSNF